MNPFKTTWAAPQTFNNTNNKTGSSPLTAHSVTELAREREREREKEKLLSRAADCSLSSL
jgi:hypothetical protein